MGMVIEWVLACGWDRGSDNLSG